METLTVVKATSEDPFDVRLTKMAVRSYELKDSKATAMLIVQVEERQPNAHISVRLMRLCQASASSRNPATQRTSVAPATRS